METTSQLEDRYQIATYARLPFPISKGENCYVYSDQGDKYLDLYGGHAVVSTGHCHPKVVKAIQDQAKNLIFYSNVVNLEIRGQAAQALIECAPPGLTKVFFANSGSEANENAIKLARMVTKKKTVISFEGGFHGRTMAALSATGIEKFQKKYNPLLSHHKIVAFGDSAAVADIMGEEDCAGVLLEPIQSMAGVRGAPAEFYQNLRKLCDKSGAKLIYDEIQTGIGRTGEFFFAPLHDVVPDMMTLAKGLASGVPVGAVLVKEDIASMLHSGDLGSTFGGGPLAAAALKATLEVIKEEELLANVKKVGRLLCAELVNLTQVKSVSGRGFLLGLTMNGKASYYQEQLLAKKMIVGTSNDPQVVRLLPPLTLNLDQVNEFLDTLAKIPVKA